MRILRLSRPILASMAMVAICLLFTGHLAAAATSQNITLSPSSTQFDVAAGTTTINKFDVINEGDTSFDVGISSAPYYVKGLEYDPHFTQLAGTLNASEWVKFLSPTTQSLDANKLTTIDYSLSVPENTPAGGYYAVLFAETIPKISSGVVARNRVGNILYITVKGDIKQSGSVSVGKLGFFNTAASIPLTVFVSNTGGTHFITTANVMVKDIFGHTAYKGTSDRYVLPQTTRQVDFSWSPTTPIDAYSITTTATVAGTEKSVPVRWILVVQPWVLIVFILAVGGIIASIIIRKGGKKK